MKNEDIEILEKVLVLIECFSDTEPTLIARYKSLCDKYKIKNEKEKQHYRSKQDYHRDYTKVWRSEHPEQVKKHQDAYRKKKQAEKQRRKKSSAKE